MRKTSESYGSALEVTDTGQVSMLNSTLGTGDKYIMGIYPTAAVRAEACTFQSNPGNRRRSVQFQVCARHALH